MRPREDTWRWVALELVEQVAAAGGRREALGFVFSCLRRHVDFDCASAISLEGAPYQSFDKPEACGRAWGDNGARYLDEARRVLEGPAVSLGVILDREAMSARERDRASFYREYLGPLGTCNFAMFLVRSGSSTTQLLSLTRTGASSFHVAEMQWLRRLHATVSIAARVFPGVSGIQVPTLPSPPSPLTAREADIVAYLVRGLQNAEIADCLGTSRNTVRNQVQHLFRKLDVSTRAELVAVVLANGWTRGFHQSEDERPDISHDPD